MKKKLFFLTAILSLGFFSGCDDDNEYMLGDPSKVTPTIEIAAEDATVQAGNGGTVQLKAVIVNPSGLKSVDIVSADLGIQETITVNAPDYVLNKDVTIPASTQEGLYVVTITANSDNLLTISKDIRVIVGSVNDETAPVIKLLSDTEEQYKSSVEFKVQLTDNVGLKSIRVWSEDEPSINDSIELNGLAEYEYVSVLTLPAGYSKKTLVINVEVVDLLDNKTTMDPATFKVNVLPEELYLIGGATEAGWEPDAALPFNRTGEGKFELVATLKSDGYGFKFIGARDWEHGVWGFEEKRGELLPEEFTGDLYESGGSENITPVENEGLYRISVDIDNLTFTISKITYPDQLFLVGGSSEAGWSPGDAVPFRKLALGKFRLFTYLEVDGGGIKFLPEQGSWSNDWGMKPGEEGILAVEGEENVPVAESGFYAIEIDYNTNTYQLTKMEFGLIGDLNGWGSVELMSFEPVKGNYKFTITHEFISGGGFKFKWNEANNWTYNFGASASPAPMSGEAAFDGGNLNIPEAGRYDIELNLDPAGYTYSIVKQ